MKPIITVFILLTMVACDGILPVVGVPGLGVVRKKDNSEHDDAQDHRLNSLDQRLLNLEQLYEAQQAAINLLGLEFSDLEEAQELIEDALADIFSRLDDLDHNDSRFAAAIIELQNQIDSILAARENSIVEVLDPCGNGPGMDEVLLKLGNGDIIAYFQSGSNRHLSILPPGNYVTTDAQHCSFTITVSGELND